MSMKSKTESLKRIKVLHTIPDLGIKSGGPTSCVIELMNAMRGKDFNVDLLTLASDEYDGSPMKEREPWLKVLDNDKISPIGYSRNLCNNLYESDYDVYHTNGLWMYCNHITAKVARTKDRPFVLTPHGMLHPRALKRSFWKKWPVRKLWFDKDILSANCIHVTCKQEATYVRDFGYKGPIALIANPVSIPNYVKVAENKPQGKKIIGFLGRLHPVKHVENILYGIAISSQKIRESLLFQIMGTGDAQYERFLHAETKRLGLQDIVEFVGFVSGKEKYDRLRNFSALFVPSEFENFGMIVTEALICGTPVMASLDTPWEILNQERCGWWIDKSPEAIAEVLIQIDNMTEKEIIEMGTRGRQLVESNFSSDIIAQKMIDTYSWIINGGEKPYFIY